MLRNLQETGNSDRGWYKLPNDDDSVLTSSVPIVRNLKETGRFAEADCRDSNYKFQVYKLMCCDLKDQIIQIIYYEDKCTFILLHNVLLTFAFQQNYLMQEMYCI